MPASTHPSGTRPDGHVGRRTGPPSTALILIGLGALSSFLYASFALSTKGIPLAFPLLTIRKGIIPSFLVHFSLLFALYLAAAWFAFRERPNARPVILTLFACSIVFRAILLWTEPVLSDDLYRYVWDGRVQAAGLSPYLHAPEAPELSHLRDVTIYPRINRPWARTIYPPGAQWLFRAIYAARLDSVLSLKGTIVTFDLLTITLLLKLLRMLRLPDSRAILYAWNPLVVFELAGSGHLDGLMLPFVLLCLIFSERRRDAWAGVSLGVATAIKLYPALLIPALVRRHGPRLLLSAAATVGLLYLSYVPTAGREVLGFLPQYLSDPKELFNPGPGALLAFGLGSLTSQPTRVAYVVLALALLTVSLRSTRSGDEGLEATVPEVLLMFGTFVTFAQTVHPWYLLWILPLLAIRPSACWLYLSGAIALSYLRYTDDQFRLPVLAGVLEYLPFYLLALWASRARKLRRVGSGLIGQVAGGRTS